MTVSSAVEISPLKPEHYKGMLAVVRDLVGTWFTENAFGNMRVDFRYGNGFVACQGDDVIGFLTFNVKEAKAEITWLGLLKKHHRSGLGRKLLNALKKEMSQAGVKGIYVNTLGDSVDYEPYARTRAFYRAMGFKDHKRIMQPENADCPECLTLLLDL
jgi:ribosomal protein S18 acetylase RimI-like enzyme